MAGAVEGGVQVATGFMDAMKREPLSLALVLMNMALLLFFYVILIRVADQRKEEIGLLYADKKEVRELLAQCVVPEREDRRRGSLPMLPPSSTVFKLPPEYGRVVQFPPLPLPRPSTAPRDPTPADDGK